MNARGGCAQKRKAFDLQGQVPLRTMMCRGTWHSLCHASAFPHSTLGVQHAPSSWRSRSATTVHTSVQCSPVVPQGSLTTSLSLCSSLSNKYHRLSNPEGSEDLWPVQDDSIPRLFFNRTVLLKLIPDTMLSAH